MSNQTVYVLCEEIDYEGCMILGVYGERESAKAEAQSYSDELHRLYRRDPRALQWNGDSSRIGRFDGRWLVIHQEDVR